MANLALYNSEYERDRLTLLFVKRYGGMLRAVHGLLTRALNRELPPPEGVALRHILLEARARAVKVDASTQFAISAMLAKGVQLGLTTHEIANGTADGSYPGIEGLFTKTWARRAETIARTELQNAQLQAAVEGFRSTGGQVRALIAHDGDHDAACSVRDGREYPLSNPPEILHPNCRLTVSPVFAEGAA